MQNRNLHSATTTSPFDGEGIHPVLRRFAARGEMSSKGLGWSTIFASVQREQPFKARFEANDNALLVTAASGGPIDVTFRINGRVVARHWHFRERRIFFLPPRHDCEVTLDSSLKTIHVYLRGDLFDASDKDASTSGFALSPLLADPEPITSGLLAVLEEMLREADPSSSLMADCVSHAIANRLNLLQGSDPNARPARASARQLGVRNARAIRDFVEANIADRITLEDLAAVCGVRPQYFIRVFRSSFGISPHRYVLGLRIAHAKRLLADPRCSLAEIASRCGFSHQAHFTNTFRQITGATPGSYRRSMAQ
jgi:AraC family transcriptional regulator